GCVSPFAIRLLLRDVETGGNTAGRVYALSTAGSILGTFLPVFWFIPTYGTRPTLEGFGLALVGISIAGLWPRRRLYASFAAAVIIAWIFLPSGIKPPQVGQLVYEKESAYHYIQVVRDGSKTELILNEGEAVHSIYDSQSLVTGGPWDYMVVANSFRSAQASELRPADIAILGLAGGPPGAPRGPDRGRLRARRCAREPDGGSLHECLPRPSPGAHHPRGPAPVRAGEACRCAAHPWAHQRAVREPRGKQCANRRPA